MIALGLCRLPNYVVIMQGKPMALAGFMQVAPPMATLAQCSIYLNTSLMRRRFDSWQ